MTSLSRIKSSNVHLGNSYVFGKEKKEADPESLLSAEEKLAIASARKTAEDIVNEAKAEAAKIIEQAHQQGNEIIQQYQQAGEQARNEGYQAGYQQGYTDGQAKLYQDIASELRKLDSLAASAFSVKKEIISSSEEEILKLSVAIAEKIIRHELELNPEIVVNIIKSAINELKDREEVKIIVNPSFANLLMNQSEELKETVNGLKNLKILEDKSIPADGVIIESGESRIDARLDSQISEIMRVLISEYEENPVFEEIPKEIEIRIEEPKDD